MSIDDDQRFELCLHEAAHAVAALAVGGIVHRIDLHGNGGGGVLLQAPLPADGGERNEDLAVISYAGAAAVKRYTGKPQLAADDERRGREAARGVGLARLRERAERIVASRWREIVAVALHLFGRDEATLPGGEVLKLVEQTRRRHSNTY